MSNGGRDDLQTAAAATCHAQNDPPRSVEAVYQTLGELDELTMVLAASVRRLAHSVRALPAIVDGLRIDDLSDPIESERARDSAAENLSLACASIDLAQTGIAGAPTSSARPRALTISTSQSRQCWTRSVRCRRLRPAGQGGLAPRVEPS